MTYFSGHVMSDERSFDVVLMRFTMNVLPSTAKIYEQAYVWVGVGKWRGGGKFVLTYTRNGWICGYIYIYIHTYAWWEEYPGSGSLDGG